MTMSESIIDKITFIDRSGLTTRDVRILESIGNWPGQNGSDLFERLGLRSRSSVQGNLPKLIKYGMIIDEREREQQAIPGRYYITPKGDEFLKRILL